MRWIVSAGLLLLAAACGQQGSPDDIVKIDGSSTVFPITEAIAENFQNEYRGTYRVTVGVSGTGGGFKKFCRGETHISDASRPITQTEMEKCRENGIEFIELPIALDAIAVTVNEQNDWADHLTVKELRKMWKPDAQGEITRWSQIRDSFPDRELALFGPGADSGTYDYFTAAVVGEAASSRGDFTASEDDNVLVQGVTNDVNGLAFFGMAYYMENKDRLDAVPISYKGSEPVKPSLDAARNGTYQPLTRPLFIYVSKQAADKSEAVRRLVETYLDPEVAAPLVQDVGYVPLPESAYQLALENFRQRVTGTAFEGGSKIGVSIEDLLQSVRSR